MTFYKIDRRGHRYWAGLQCSMCVLALWLLGAEARAAAQLEQKCVVIEVYVSEGETSQQAVAAAKQVAKSRAGIRLAVRSVDESPKAQERLAKIANHYRFDARKTPVIYACNRVIRDGSDTNDFQRKIESALEIVVYTRQGCQRCEQAKAYLPLIEQRYPGMRIVYREILGDSVAASQLSDLVRRHGKAASSTPVLHVCDDLIIGFDRPETTGVRLQQKLDRWMADCPSPPASPSPPDPAQKSDESKPVSVSAPEVARNASF